MYLHLRIPTEDLRLTIDSIFAPIGPKASQGTREVAKQALAQAVPLIEAQAWVATMPESVSLPARLAHSLKGSEQWLAAFYTLGAGVDELIAAAEPLQAFLLHNLAASASFAVFARVEANLEAWHVSAGSKLSTPQFPGDGDWPLDEGMRVLASAFHPLPDGMSINAEGCLTPLYSGAALLGIGEFASTAPACEYCARRQNCAFSRSKP